jgi:protein-L-isoaspartate(D-aspartate) O-methyltransferase
MPMASEDSATSFTQTELALVRRAYARQMLAILDVRNEAIEAAYAKVPRERFLGPPPWRMSSPYAGYRELADADPLLVYQDVLFALDRARGVNNGSPSLHAKLLDALGPRLGDRIVHIGAGAGYYTAILSELVGPSGQVTAVEFDPILADQAKQNLADRANVSVVVGDGAAWPQAAVDGVYVNYAVARPAERWIDNLAQGGRLVFPLGVPGAPRPDIGGRHSERGAALRIERRPAGFAARAVNMAFFVWAEGALGDLDTTEIARLRESFETGGLGKVHSLVWKAPADAEQCWFTGDGWALCFDEVG